MLCPNRLLVVIVILVAMIVVMIMVVRTNPSWWLEDIPTTLDRSETLELVVSSTTTTQDVGIGSQPVFNVWEIADELWRVPRYISDDIEFQYGTITINRPGVFELTVSLVIDITNFTVKDLNPLVKMRIVKGSISHRYEYSIEQYISNVGNTLYSPHGNRGIITLVSQVIIEITPVDIADGRNAATLQYMIEFSEPESTAPGGLRRVSVERNTNDMTSNISLVAIN